MMDADVLTVIGAVQRRVETVPRDGKDAKVAHAVRTYDAAIEDVWDALTNPERLPRWFLPVSGDLRPGGRYQFEGNAGGEVERCDKPHAVAVTWEFGGEVSWLEVRLSETGDATLLELVHTAYVDPERWTEFGPGAVGVGWDLSLYGLYQHLTTGAAIDPQEAEAWSMSPEGIEFISACSDGWTQAAIADGDDPEAAQAAGARTTAVYTGQPPAGA
jgi:uncharacterized protein YndB with AHSA1/START domain